MKKIIYFSILSLFFSCYLQAQQSSQDPVKTQSPNKAVDKKEEKNRNVANNQNTLSKASVLGEDYYKPLESAPLRKAVGTHLQAITAVCETQKSLNEKVDHVHNTLKDLMRVIQNYLKQRLKSDDGLFLRTIRDNIEELIPLFDAIKQSPSINILDAFVRYYHFYYNLPDNTSVKEFPDEWAKQIYYGLECLYEK